MIIPQSRGKKSSSKLLTLLRNQGVQFAPESPVQFEPEWGVQFGPELPVQFEPEWGVQFGPEYPHNNPIKAGLVYRAQDYVYSSALDYADEKGMLDTVVVFQYLG